MREVRNPFRAQEAAALRKAERQAQAQDDPGPKEDAPQALGGEASHPVNSRDGDEAVSFRIRHGGLPFGGLDDVAPLLASLDAAGGAGSPEEFRPIVRAARAC